jgi:hypothetical protein
MDRRSAARSLAPCGRARTMTGTRRLAAIVAADVAGYSRLMGQDEEGTDGIDYARKLCQEAVAGVLYDPAPVLGDLRLDQFPKVGLEALVRDGSQTARWSGADSNPRSHSARLLLRVNGGRDAHSEVGPRVRGRLRPAASLQISGPRRELGAPSMSSLRPLTA